MFYNHKNVCSKRKNSKHVSPKMRIQDSHQCFTILPFLCILKIIGISFRGILRDAVLRGSIMPREMKIRLRQNEEL